MKVIPLKDGDFAVTKNKEFTLLENAGEDTQLTMAIQPFLIILQEEYLLLDAGLGWMQDEKPVIIQNLEKENISPGDITKILLSHLHKDHINGLVRPEGNSYELNFPNAEVYLQKREYEYVQSKKESSSFDFEILEFIIQNARIVWMDEDRGQLSPEVYFEVTVVTLLFTRYSGLKKVKKYFSMEQIIYLKVFT